MQRLLFSLLLVINFSLSLFASNATEEHLVSLSPAKGADSVKPKSLVKVAFDREIIKSSVTSNTITLQPINPKGKKVSTKITIEEKSTLVLTPNELLKEGEYRVRVNSLRLKADKDDYQLSSFMKKLLYWLCSLFYDDISDCPLYKKFYNTPTYIKTKTIQYTFSVIDRPEILNIKLNATSLELNEGDSVQLNAVATYDNNTTKDVTQEVLWNITDPSVASIDTNATLTALQEGTAQITATLENITSQTLSLSVRKVINGHLLPPMPDKTLNDSTLLGIDSNNNGVRDDVERKIYFTYDKKINQKLMMQSAKRHQSMLADLDLIKNAYDWEEASNKDIGCKNYLFDKYDIPFIKNRVNFYQDNTYNTEERIRKYMKYNNALSGGVFGAPVSAEVEASCDFNVTEVLGF